EAGMIDECVTWADELLEYAAAKQDGLPPDVAAFTRAYGAMQKGIKGAAGKPNAAEDWRRRLGATTMSPQAHYTLIYWDAGPAEVQRRAAVLEENFKGFFLWHATRGIELPLPEAPLVAVLPKRGSVVFNLARALD